MAGDVALSCFGKVEQLGSGRFVEPGPLPPWSIFCPHLPACSEGLIFFFFFFLLLEIANVESALLERVLSHPLAERRGSQRNTM